MAGYMNDPNAVVQNLRDAGCDDGDVKVFMELAEAGNRQEQYKFLEKHRKVLLEKVHIREKQIDCLDYLVFQMKKETGKKERGK